MVSNTSITNMALDELGATRINNLETDSSPSAIKARLHFEQTRDALIRSHSWRFARARATLSQDTVDPEFEWDNQFILPSDFLAARSVFGEFEPTENTRFSYALEGDRLLTNQSEINMRYTKRVTDPTEFDELFIEVFVLKLALKLSSLSGANPKIKADIKQSIALLMPRVRAMDKQETNTKGRANRRSWNDSRFANGGRIDSRLGN